MKVINGIIIDGKLYRAVANGKLCYLETVTYF